MTKHKLSSYFIRVVVMATLFFIAEMLAQEIVYSHYGPSAI